MRPMTLLNRTTLTLALLGALSLGACGPKKGPVQSYSEEQLATDPVANFRLGVHLLETPRKDGSIDYEGAYRRFRNAAELGGSAKAHFNAGWTAEKLLKADDAARHYGRAFEADPAYPAAMHSYARVLVETGNAAQAVEVYRAHLGRSPKDKDIRIELVGVLGAAGLYDEALTEAQQVLLTDPNSAKTYRALASLYFAQGNYGMSLLCSEKALQLDEADGGTYNNMAVTYLGLGEDGAAIGQLQDALKVDPNNFEANTNLGYIALNSGDYGLAVSTLETAVRVNPESTIARLGLAVAYRGVGEYDKADALYRALSTSNPTSQPVFFNASTLHEKYTRDFDKALGYLQTYVTNSGVGPSDEAFARMERVKATKAEVERVKAEEEAKRKAEEDRRKRNEELLAGMATKIEAFSAKVEANAACLGPDLVEEASMLIEQAGMVIESQEASMAPDIQSMLDEYYGPMIDEAIATQCGGGGSEEGAE